jgi:hypothetical protein
MVSALVANRSLHARGEVGGFFVFCLLSGYLHARGEVIEWILFLHRAPVHLHARGEVAYE